MTQEQEVRVAALDIALRLYLGSDDLKIDRPEEENKEGVAIYSESIPLTPKEIICNYASYFEDFINVPNRLDRPY
jgi:hypothetical protein